MRSCGRRSWSRSLRCPTRRSPRRCSGRDALGVDPLTAPAHVIAAAVRAGELRATVVVAATLAHIAKRNPVLNAFTAVTGARALATAQAIDAARAQGRPLGPLA